MLNSLKFLAGEIGVNSLYVGVICYFLLPYSGVYLQPNFADCLVFGTTLFLLGACLRTVEQ